MDTGIQAGRLERLLNEVRKNTIRNPEIETIDEWLAKTWHMALLRYEHEKPTLPRVEEREARQDELRKQAGMPEKEQASDETD